MRLFLVTILIIATSYLGVMKNLQLSFFSFASPVILYLKESSLYFQDMFLLFSNIDEVRKENIRLKSLLSETQLTALKNSLNKLNKIESENLSESVKNSSILGSKKVDIKKIIYYDSFGSRLYLENYSQEKYQKGSLVIYNDSLIGVVNIGEGEVLEVYLVSNKEINLNTSIINRELIKIKTVLDSESGDSLVINNILATEEVAEGDLVVTSNNNYGVIPDLIIGRLQRIEGISSQTFRKAYISKFYDLNSISYVGVVRND